MVFLLTFSMGFVFRHSFDDLINEFPPSPAQKSHQSPINYGFSSSWCGFNTQPVDRVNPIVDLSRFCPLKQHFGSEEPRHSYHSKEFHSKEWPNLHQGFGQYCQRFFVGASLEGPDYSLLSKIIS